MDLGAPQNAWFCLSFWGDLKSAWRLTCVLLRFCLGFAKEYWKWTQVGLKMLGFA